MGGSHNHHHHHHAGSGNIKIAFFLNLGFALIEVVGGLLTNSLAVLSDAVHDFGDTLSIGLAWFLQYYSQKPGNTSFTYGYRRFSLLGALITGLILTGGSVYILIQAWQGIFEPHDVHAPGMFLLAVLGVAVNGYAAWRLGKGLSRNEKMLKWHLMEDVLGWVAILVASVVLIFWDIPFLDPLLAIAITIYILFNVLKNLKETFTLFLQGTPVGVEIKEIENRISSIAEVLSVHHLHVWSLDGEHHVLTAHIVVEEDTDIESTNRIREKVRELVQGKEITHVTLEVEYGHTQCKTESDS